MVTNCFTNRNLMQTMRMLRGAFFFLLGFLEGGRWELGGFFFPVPSMFPSSSQDVHVGFPTRSSSSQHVPNSSSPFFYPILFGHCSHIKLGLRHWRNGSPTKNASIPGKDTILGSFLAGVPHVPEILSHQRTPSWEKEKQQVPTPPCETLNILHQALSTTVLGHPDPSLELPSARRGGGRGVGLLPIVVLIVVKCCRTLFQAFVVDYVHFFHLQNTAVLCNILHMHRFENRLLIVPSNF
jgi:hypothetical protein